jgi:putative MATE family efflux protein
MGGGIHVTSVAKRFFSKKSESVDFVNGSIPRALIRYSFPILIGNILQYLYSAVDAWVLGQSGQTEAYAAVGSLSSVTQTLVALFWGFSQGAGIVIARAHGARDSDRVSRGAHTALVITFFIGAFLTVVGMLLSPQLLRFVLGADGDPEIYRHAKTYLLIFFGGIIPMLIYNIGAEIMRSLGNSRYPFLFLCVGSILNILLDLLFVFVFHLGIAGVAWATVLAQALAALLVLAVLFSHRSPMRLSARCLRIDRALMMTIIRLGIPVAIQHAIVNVSAMFTQSYIAGTDGNQTAVLGGYGTFTRTLSILCQPAAVVQGAVAVFVGQNLGAGNFTRVRSGTRWGVILATGTMLPLCLGVTFFSEYVPYIFTSDAAVVAHAAELFRYLTLFYLIEALCYPSVGAMRGLGFTTQVMVLTMATDIAFRQLYLFVMANYISNSYLPIVFSIPAGTILYGLLATVIYARCMRRFSRQYGMPSV